MFRPSSSVDRAQVFETWRRGFDSLLGYKKPLFISGFVFNMSERRDATARYASSITRVCFAYSTAVLRTLGRSYALAVGTGAFYLRPLFI